MTPVQQKRVRAEEHPAAGRQQVTAQLDVDERPAGQYPDRAVEAQRLGDHRAGERQPAQGLVVGIGTGQHEVGFLLEPFLDLRVLSQQVAGPGEGVPGRLGAGDDEGGRLVAQLLVGHPRPGAVVARAHQDRDEVAVVLSRRPVTVDDVRQQGAQAPVGSAETAVGPGRDPRQARNIRADPLGHEFGQQHTQQLLDLVDRTRADVGGQERPGQHGQRDRPHLPVEGKRPAVLPGADARHRDTPHRARVAGDLGAVECGLHEPPLTPMAFAFGHHQPAAYQPLGPSEVEALAQPPGLADQRLPDGARTVQHVDAERPEPDADHITVLPGLLEQRERITPELQRVPQQQMPARHRGDVSLHHVARCGHRPR
jgi:hypothetical protein